MRPSFLKKKRAMSDEMSLQITSMADIFTILLVFMLKSYSTGAASLAPSQGLSLPEAHAESSAVEALKIEVSRDLVQVEGTPVLSLKDYQFPKQDMNAQGASLALTAVLSKERKRQLEIAKQNTEVSLDARVVIVADKSVPYSTIKTVLASAATQGYTDFRLAVVKGE